VIGRPLHERSPSRLPRPPMGLSPVPPNSPHPRKRTGGASNLIGDGVCLLLSLSKHSIDGGATGGDDAGARITADPTTTPVAISLAPTTPARPPGLVRSPSMRPPEPAALCAVLIAPAAVRGLDCPMWP
jgi:hypothetical protein